MMCMKLRLLLLLLLFALLAGCGPGPDTAIPTLFPVAELPTNSPSPPAALPPTRDLRTPTPAAATAVLPTPAAAANTPSPEPVEARLNLSSPGHGAVLVLDSNIVARGLAQVDTTHTISVTLVSVNGRFLSGAVANVNAVGWEAGLYVPPNVGGAATLHVRVLDSNGNTLAQDSAAVTLALDASSSSRYLALYNPVEGDTAVAGHYLFFDGRAQQPVGNRLTISVWVDECQNQAASFTFNVSGSGYWQGQLGLPNNLTGPACAIASFGNSGEETWREVQVPINILASSADTTAQVSILNPAPGSIHLSGQSIYVSGIAFNANTVQIAILLENGRVIAERTTMPDSQGAWETELLLPFDVAGAAEILVNARSGAGILLAEASRLILINPGPTVTPES